MYNTIVIDRNNIIFKGAGAENTTLKFVKPWDCWYDYGVNKHYDFLRIIGNSANVISNVGIEDLKIIRQNECNYTQGIAGSYTGMFVRYNYAQNCWIQGVEFDNAGRNYVYITNSNNLEFKGCYFHHGWFYGEGGNGYGIQIGEYSNKCLIENNVFGRLRHAIVLSDEAHHNVIAYNSMDEQHSEYPFIIDPFEWVIPDMCIHGHNDLFLGGGPYENLFEGNCGSYVRIDKEHGSNGPRNLIFRNIADEVGIEICGGNDDQVIVNNYFKCSNTAVTTFWDVPWASSWLDPPQNTYFKNNKCKRNDLTGWHIYWKPSYDPSYYNDVSYYKDSIPDFMTEDKWPFDTVNQINPAEERRDNSWGITQFSEFTNYIITDPNYIFLESYYYGWNNPTNSNSSKNELCFIYHNCSTQSPVVTYSLEKEDGTLIVDNQSISKHTSNFNHRAFPLSSYYKRKIIQDYEGPLTIKIYEDDVLKTESTVEYDPSNKPPIPILFSSSTEPKGIYPSTQSGGYCSQVYFGNYYTLKLNAPYQGDIDTWYKISIMWEEEDGTHRYDLNNTPYVQSNNNGTFDIQIPQECYIPNTGTYSNIRLKLNDVPSNPNSPVCCISNEFR